MTPCSEAGPLGREVRHPGPIVAYVLGETVIPAWLGEGLMRNLYHGDFYRDRLDPVYQSEWEEAGLL